MRIITGKLRGRVIKSVPGRNTRPTADKVKESSFQIMGPYFEEGACLDLFAGSGNLGIEALSRGMKYCVFIDNNFQAIQTIKQNIRTLNLENCTEIYRTNAFKAIDILSEKSIRFNLVFIDPPYQKIQYDNVLTNLVKGNIIADGGLIYCEHSPEESKISHLEDFKVVREITYSKAIAVTILQYNEKREDL